MNKRKTINIEPYNLDLKKSWDDGKFTFEFASEKHLIKIHLENWWVDVIARSLLEVINQQQEKLNHQRKVLAGDA
jgi:hypothetical protein